MKLSVSLSDADVEFLDEYARDNGVASRSAAVQRAIRLLKSSQLVSEYEAAFREWAEQESDWDAVAGDGLAQS